MENAGEFRIKLETALEIIDMITSGASISEAMDKFSVSRQSVDYIMKNKDDYKNCLKLYPGLTVDRIISIQSLKRNLPMDHYMLTWMRENFEAQNSVTAYRFKGEAIYYFLNILNVSISTQALYKWMYEFEKRHKVTVVTMKKHDNPEARLEAVKKTLDNVEHYGPTLFSLSSPKLPDCQFSTVPDVIPDYSDAKTYNVVRKECATVLSKSKHSFSFTEKQDKEFRSALSELFAQSATISQEDFFKKLLMNDDWAPFGQLLCSRDLAWTINSVLICEACYDASSKKNSCRLSLDYNYHKLAFDRTIPSRFCSNCYRHTRQYRRAAECSDCYYKFWRYKIFYKSYRHFDDFDEFVDETNY